MGKERRLPKWFKLSGLTYTELAEKTGYSKATVYLVVNGKRLRRPFSRRCLSKIAATLIWHCKKKGRNPETTFLVAEIKCSCGRVHSVYLLDGKGKVETVEKGVGT